MSRLLLRVCRLFMTAIKMVQISPLIVIDANRDCSISTVGKHSNSLDWISSIWSGGNCLRYQMALTLRCSDVTRLRRPIHSEPFGKIGLLPLILTQTGLSKLANCNKCRKTFQLEQFLLIWGWLPSIADGRFTLFPKRNASFLKLPFFCGRVYTENKAGAIIFGVGAKILAPAGAVLGTVE